MLAEIIKCIMSLRNFSLILISSYCVACHSNKQKSIQSAEEVSKSIAKAKENTLAFEGKFVKLEKITERDYLLLAKDNYDSVITFLTMMPLSEAEIRLLRKDGNNIKLNYSNFYNPTKKVTEKIVKSMEPIYEFEIK
jgi:hypothetical protein